MSLHGLPEAWTSAKKLHAPPSALGVFTGMMNNIEAARREGEVAKSRFLVSPMEFHTAKTLPDTPCRSSTSSSHMPLCRCSGKPSGLGFPTVRRSA